MPTKKRMTTKVLPLAINPNLLLGDMLEAFIQWLKKIWFEAKLKARLKMIEIRAQAEAERELEEWFEPLYTEKPPENPDSPASLLGGEMRLTSKWHQDSKDLKK
jgi:hypothetical protein